jgi:hypothetical protein
MDITSVKLLDNNIIEITDLAGQRLTYRPNEFGILELGYQYVITNDNYQVYLFMPLGAQPLPKLLAVIPIK